MIRVVLLLTLLLAVPACKQGVGDRCQLDSDCEDGLFCDIPNSGSRQDGGKCLVIGAGLDMYSTADFAAPADLAERD